MNSDESPDGALTALLYRLKLEEGDLKDELTALSSILGETALKSFSPSRPPSLVDLSEPSDSRYIAVSCTLLSPHHDVPLELLCTLPASYPAVAPTIQLRNVFLGDFATDHLLWGEILRIFWHDGAWSEGEAVLFEGIERAKDIATEWYTRKLDEKPAIARSVSPVSSASPENEVPAQSLPTPHVELAMSDPIADRKSVFVGWAAALSSPADVAMLLDSVKADKKVAKATHNIFAWRCRTADGILHQDNDDDGETAAGARLAHLLELLKIDNVLVVVSRWYGGIHLGADRFKHINVSARAALEVRGIDLLRLIREENAQAGGFLHDEKTTRSKSRKH